MTDDDGHGAFSPDGVNTQTDNALETTGAIPSCTNRNLRFNHARTNGRWMVFAGLRNLIDGACSETPGEYDGKAYDAFRHRNTLARQVKGERLAEK